MNDGVKGQLPTIIAVPPYQSSCQEVFFWKLKKIEPSFKKRIGEANWGG